MTSSLAPNQTGCVAMQKNAIGAGYFFTAFLCYLQLPYICQEECEWRREILSVVTLPAIRAIWFTQAGHVPRSTSTVVPGKRGWVGVRIDWVDRNVVPGPTKHLSPGICPVLINQAVRKALLGLDWAFSEKWPDEYCIAQRYYFITLRVLKYNICLRCFSIINFSFIIRENESILEWDKCWH